MDGQGKQKRVIQALQCERWAGSDQKYASNIMSIDERKQIARYEQ